MTTRRAENNEKQRKKNRRKTKHEHKMGLQMGWARKARRGGVDLGTGSATRSRAGVKQFVGQYGQEKKDLHDL